MNINSVDNTPNFTGLWGKQKESLIDRNQVWLLNRTKTYYPFKEETKEEIDKIKKANSYNLTFAWPEYGFDFVYDQTLVRDESPLTFSQKEFNAYKATRIGAKTPEELSNPLEKELVKLGLYKYLNNAKEYMQELAKRDTFTYKVKQLFRKIKAMFK